MIIAGEVAAIAGSEEIGVALLGWFQCDGRNAAALRRAMTATLTTGAQSFPRYCVEDLKSSGDASGRSGWWPVLVHQYARQKLPTLNP